jgi:hypothetical protein
VNQGVNILPRGQISPLGARVEVENGPWGPGLKLRMAPGARGEIKNGPLPSEGHPVNVRFTILAGIPMSSLVRRVVVVDP